MEMQMQITHDQGLVPISENACAAMPAALDWTDLLRISEGSWLSRRYQRCRWCAGDAGEER